MAFAYELLYSMIKVCARSAAMTTVGTAIGEAMALADADCKFCCSPCMVRFFDIVEKEYHLPLIKYLFPFLKQSQPNQFHGFSTVYWLAKHSNTTK